MKRLISVTLLFAFLNANTAFTEVFKLPTLIHHCIEHMESDNYSLFEFLATHYTNKINHPDDKHRDHENLPFKTLNYQIIQIVTTLPHTSFNNFMVFAQKSAPKNIFYQSKNYSKNFLNSIWQPPRFN